MSTTDCNWQWVRSLKDDGDLSYNIIGLGYFGTSCTACSFFPPPLRRCYEPRKCGRTSRVLWNCCWYLSTWGRWHQFRIMSRFIEQCPSFLQSLKHYRSFFQYCNANGVKMVLVTNICFVSIRIVKIRTWAADLKCDTSSLKAVGERCLLFYSYS